MGDKDFRVHNPRFAGAAGHANQTIADAVAQVAERKGITPPQVALAWVHGQAARLGISLAPIQGTKQAKWLEQNAAAVQITLTPAATRHPPRSDSPTRDYTVVCEAGKHPSSGDTRHHTSGVTSTFSGPRTREGRTTRPGNHSLPSGQRGKGQPE